MSSTVLGYFRPSVRNRWLTTTAVVASFDLCVVVGSLVVSLVSGDWPWFQRSGSLLAVMGALDCSRDARAKRVGTTLVIAGTLIWGYGDLVGGI